MPEKPKAGEWIKELSTTDLISELVGRKDIGQHQDQLSLLLDTAKNPIPELKAQSVQFAEAVANNEVEHLPSTLKPFCQTKIFARSDSTDFIQISPPYQIGEREEFWQKKDCDFMLAENQSPPTPCHEVNFYQSIVASRIHSSEGLVAKVSDEEYRLNRPFDQIIGKTFNPEDTQKAIEEGLPWLSTLIAQPFPVFTLGERSASVLQDHFSAKSPLNIEVVNITGSAVGPSNERNNQVAQYLEKLSQADLSTGIQLWNNEYFTSEAVRTMATTINTWMDAVSKKTYSPPTMLVRTPWINESTSNQAYLNALFGQTFLHLIYPLMTREIQNSGKIDPKFALSKLPSFSTSPIRHASIMMLSGKEYEQRQGYKFGSSPIVDTDNNATSDSSKRIEEEIKRLKEKPMKKALDEWKQSINVLLPVT